MSLSSARIVALKLHALHQDDREWIFSRLDPVTQERLAPLLDELKELGLEIESDWMDSIENINIGSNDVLPNSGAWLDPELVAVIDSVLPWQIEHIFDQEPAILFQCLKAMHPWTWAAEFDQVYPKLGLSSLTVKGSGNAPFPSHAVKKALLKTVARQLVVSDHIGNSLRDEMGSRCFPVKMKPMFQQFFDKIIPWKQ